MKDNRILFVIDEADVLVGDDNKSKLAEFIKHLSDYESQFKVLVVGISSTGRDLICNHKSVERCLNEISLLPIAITELINIIKKGEEKTGLNFDSDVINDIVDVSGGYPHFVHLIALKCAEIAVIERDKDILPICLAKALKMAASFSEGNLIRTYEGAISKNTGESRKIILAAALCHPRGFLVSELLEMTNQVIAPELGKHKIKSCLYRWMKSTELNLIVRVERGHYKFSDPRIMSYVKMINGFSFDKNSVVADILKSEYAQRYV